MLVVEGVNNVDMPQGNNLDNMFGDFLTSMIRILGGSDWKGNVNVHFRI
jgi:hypothetical protein